VKRKDRLERGILIVNVLLSPDEEKFLKGLGEESRRLGGRKLGKSEILRALTQVLQELAPKMDLEDIKNQKDFVPAVSEIASAFREEIDYETGVW